METSIQRHWHNLPIEEIFNILETSPDEGLDIFEIKHRQEHYGPNEITTKKGRGPVARFLLQFNQPLVYILLVATLITLFLQEWVDAAVIFAVVLINTIIGFLQESKAIKAIEALAKTMSYQASVLRAGERVRVNARELVPGDIVLLQSGDKVPADLRLFRVRDLQIDESALTGESVPVEKDIEPREVDLIISDRRNMAYSSTLVTYGTGSGVVIASGDHTEIGQISELITSAEVLRTPLTEKITHFSTILLYIILVLAGLTFLVGYIRGENWVDMFMASVALAVGAIPEGLPAAITITLAIGVARMAKRNAIIRKLPAVETLGSTTVICSDKTGTLTQNQMTVSEIVASGIHYGITGAGYKPEGEFRIDGEATDPGSNYALIECLKAGLICNDSSLRKIDDQWRVEGDPTEGALIVSALKAGLDPKELERTLPRIDTIPFESKHQFMATLHDQGSGKPKIAYLKGSIESICMECGVLIDREGEVQIADAGQTHAWVEGMAAKGLRVLAFARIEMPAETTKITHADFDQTLEFLGLQGMMDPPRPEAITAVAAVHQAGVRVKMITGDHAATAASIGNQMQLCYPECSWHTESVITGKEILQLSDIEFIEKAERTAVFARVSPEQKLRLVEALQARNHVVAMTGDGVNDAPALRQANIGVAMGIAGTEVAKEAADMVLTDDNFATIEAAVEEGRGVFDNLRKFITWTLPTNIGEGLVIMAAVVAGTRLPILPLQILWINMTTALLLGLMLAFEPKEPELMSRPPRAPEKPILTRPLLIRVIIVSLMLLAGAFGLFELNIILGTSEEMARTVAVNVFVFGEMFYLFNCRSMIFSMFEVGLLSNPWLIIGVAVMTLLQILYTYTPLMNQLFDSAPISMLQWVEILAVSAAIYLIIGIEKRIQRRNAEAM